MKKISGSLKLELAQFREMASFAKFGSEPDKETQQLINRGNHLTELLKQSQYTPLTIEKQILSVFLGVSGSLDEIELEDVLKFENKFLSVFDENNVFLPFLRSFSDNEFDEPVFKFVVDFISNSI